ncbi:hypothetical protein JOL79_27845 [Microbispora sp. RL4-1S]|uniref:Uncharacterized protein n=1 Tax=Microbispora oryzae TaxID=2806554 RepID=A0A940WL10_9ACTN|nr:hypothetical protein [Microbispora oryzae]MBP2707600.1 hypothetical protein [Microbispora oryzae]
MASIIAFATPWLASACPAADGVQVKLPLAAAARTRATSLNGRGTAIGFAARGTAPAYVAVPRRHMGEEQTNRTSGVQGPHYAWREPVTT